MFTLSEHDALIDLTEQISDLLDDKPIRDQAKCLVAFSCLAIAIAKLPRELRRQISSYVKTELDAKVRECSPS